MNSTVNSTMDGSMVATEENAYGTSARNKALFGAIDKTLNVVEQQLQQNIDRYCLKPMRRRLKKPQSQEIDRLASEIVQEWRCHAQDAINEIVSENNVKSLLFKLDEMSDREKERGTDDGDQPGEAWRPTGHPRTDMDAHFTKAQLEYRDSLKDAYEKMEKASLEKRRAVEQGRQEVLDNDREIKALGKEIRRYQKMAKSNVDDNGKPKLTNEQLVAIRDEIKKYVEN